MSNVTSKISLLFMLVVASLALSACNTVNGVGEDLEKAGESIQDSAD
jgi:predicted small secreted protein